MTMTDILDEQGSGAATTVYRAILRELDDGVVVPGQRLIETDLAVQFGVGRNAVREAMQQLAARGIIDLSRHRSAAIRKFSLDEALDVLDVAAMMNRLIARTAASRFDRAKHGALLRDVVTRLSAPDSQDPGAFGQTRRIFYRALLQIAGNAELTRLFPSVGVHIVHAQFRVTQLHGVRVEDYRAIIEAVESGNAAAAENEAERHVVRIRELIIASSR